MMNSKFIKFLSLVLFAVVIWYASGYYFASKMKSGHGMMGMQRPTPVVFVKSAQIGSLETPDNFIGRVEAINDVSIIPQIAGMIKKIYFKGGSIVEKGELLISIDDSEYKATLDLRKAELEKAKANLKRAQKDFKRTKNLNRQKFVSDSVFDEAESNLLQAKASVKQAGANLKLAEIDLNHTNVYSPITGQIGASLVKEGNYVTPSTQSLARIVQISPIRVSFSATDKQYVKFTKRRANSDDKKEVEFSVKLPDGEKYNHKGKFDFFNNVVDGDTSSIKVYTVYPNPDKLLITGSYVEVLVSKTSGKEAIIIPQSAVMNDDHGSYVYVIKDETAHQVRIETNGVRNANQIVTLGLTVDDKIAIEGIHALKDGAKVKSIDVDVAAGDK